MLMLMKTKRTGSSWLPYSELEIRLIFTPSEDENAMDIDEAPKAQDGDLSQYNLDDYDNDAPGDSELNPLKPSAISHGT